MIIALLLALNALLGALLLAREADTYQIPAKREANLTRLLAAEHITLAAKMPRRYRPMDTLDMLPYETDIHAEAARFFKTTDDLLETTYWNGVTLSDGQSELLLEDGFLMFQTEAPFAGAEFLKKPGDPQAARKLADRTVNAIRPPGLQFALYRAEADEDGGTLYDYRGVFGGSTVYSNYIKLTVTGAGVTTARCFYSGVPAALSGYPRDVYAPDEALFALAKQLKMIYAGADVSITDMATVYNLEAPAVEAAKAAPVYKLEISVRGAGRTYLVDCYTNVVLK